MLALLPVNRLSELNDEAFGRHPHGSTQSRDRVERLGAAAPLDIGRLAPVADEHSAVEWIRRASGAWFATHKEFHALVVVGHAGQMTAFAADGSALALRTLCERVPGLDDVLARLVRG